jgi:hypothetical protein
MGLSRLRSIGQADHSPHALRREGVHSNPRYKNLTLYPSLLHPLVFFLPVHISNKCLEVLYSLVKVASVLMLQRISLLA